MHEDVVGREERRKHRDAVFLGECVDCFGNPFSQLETMSGSIESLDCRSRTIRWKINCAWRSGEVLLPEIKHAITGGTFEVRFLPADKVSVGSFDRLDLRSASCLRGEVVFDKILNHHSN